MRTYNKGRVSEFYIEYTDWKKIYTFIGLHMFWSNLFLHTAGVEKKEIYILPTMRKPISFFLSYILLVLKGGPTFCDKLLYTVTILAHSLLNILKYFHSLT